MAHQYAPTVEPGGRIVTRRWPDDPVHRSLVEHSRDDLLLERPEAGVCPDAAPPKPAAMARAGVHAGAGAVHVVPAHGRTGRRRVGRVHRVRLTIPWFGWLFRWPVRGAAAAGSISATGRGGRRPTGSTRRQLLVLGLLAAASMSCGVRQHAVHPDGQLRRRRLRRRQHRRRHRRRDRARRHRHRHPGRRARRPHRTPPDDRVGGVARTAAVGARRARPDVRCPRRHADLGAPDRRRARLPGGRRRRRGDAALAAAPTPSASWRWPPASAPASP